MRYIMEKIKASVLLLTQNNENSIKRCLDSLVAFDEVVMIDGGSKDKTLEIANSYENVKVTFNPWPGFVEQRNFSIEKASHDWCFMIDSDEAATAELIAEIRKVLSNKPDKKMYRVMRTEFYLGKAIEFGFGRSNWQERLFLKKHITYTGGVHHQHLIDGVHQSQAQEQIGNLDPDARVLHDEEYGLKDWAMKLPRFAILRAEEKIRAGRKMSGLEVFLEFPLTFFKIGKQNLKHREIGFVITLQTAIFRTLVKLIIYEKTRIGFDARDKNVKKLG